MNTKAKKTTTINWPSRLNAFKPPQNPRTQRHEGSERIAKENMCARYRLLIGWQQSPLGHQNLTRLFISSNISVVAIGSNQSLRAIYITGHIGFLKLDREFFCLLPSLARLYYAAALPSSSLRSNGSLAMMIHNTVFYMLLVLRDFIVWTLRLSLQTCLILKSFLLLLIHSWSFFNSSPSLFYRYCLLGHFPPCFRGRRREISICSSCHLSLIIIKFRSAIWLVEKSCFMGV